MYKHKYTILTPTHNRAELLQRVYNSVKEQTYKDFVWLVIDDHSIDDTLNVLKKFKDEAIIDIRIFSNPYNPGGKHTVLKYAFEICDTPYLVDIDDDDELLPDALEVFDTEWSKVADPTIGSIRSLTIDENGHIVGNIETDGLFKTFDASYLDVFYLTNLRLENLTCFKVQAVRESNIFPTSYYMKGMECFLTESIFWGRLARNYKSRYISNILRLYHYSSVSILRHKKTRQHYINSLVSSKLVFEEHNDYLRRAPKAYLVQVAIISILTCALGLKYRDLLLNMNKGKLVILMFYPLGKITAYLLYRRRYK